MMYVWESTLTAIAGVSFFKKWGQYKSNSSTSKKHPVQRFFISIIMKGTGPRQEQHSVSWVLSLCIKSSLYSVLKKVLRCIIKTHKNLFIRGFYINVYLWISWFEHLYCPETACMGSATQTQHSISITLVVSVLLQCTVSFFFFSHV